MFTHIYKDCFIHGYLDKPECRVQAYGVPATKVYKSYRAAQIAITKALKLHDRHMAEAVKQGRL